MKISDIRQQQRNENRFSVYAGKKYLFSFTATELDEHGLKIGRELTETETEELKRLSDDSVLLAKAYAKALRRPHSEKELRDYLNKNSADESTSDAIIKKLEKAHLIDDRRFAEAWYEHRKRNKKSNRFISGELRSKGVAQDIIIEVVAENDLTSLRELALKKRSRYDEQKLIAYLARQGYGFDDIKTVLAELTSEQG